MPYGYMDPLGLGCLLSCRAFEVYFECCLLNALSALLLSGPERVLLVVLLRWTPHPVIVTIRDNGDYIRVFLYS